MSLCAGEKSWDKIYCWLWETWATFSFRLIAASFPHFRTQIGANLNWKQWHSLGKVEWIETGNCIEREWSGRSYSLDRCKWMLRVVRIIDHWSTIAAIHRTIAPTIHNCMGYKQFIVVMLHLWHRFLGVLSQMHFDSKRLQNIQAL